MVEPDQMPKGLGRSERTRFAHIILETESLYRFHLS